MKSNKPNIIFIISDDHRHDAIHSIGNNDILTPILDSLINNGVAFTGTHIMGGLSGAVCMPSRASVHSGVNIFRSGGEQSINPELSLMPEVLRNHSYHTYAVGKWHNDNSSFMRSFSGGSNLFFGGMCGHYEVPLHDFNPNGDYPKSSSRKMNKHSAELFTDAAVDFLDSYKQEDPFFLYLAYTSPHDPRTAPQEYADLYDPAQIKLPDNFMEQHPFDNGALRIRDEELAGFPRTREEVGQHLADYYAMITHMDAQIGRVLEALKESGKLDQTIIIYTADHGLAVGQHGLLGKQNMYDHSVRIPLIMNGPGLPKEKRIEGLCYQMDIFPTVCELVDIPKPSTVEGVSLCGMINDQDEKHRVSVYSVYRDFQRMVKNDRYKLIRYYRVESEQLGTDSIQLFDLQDDPWELTDLSKDLQYQEILNDLVREMEIWQKRVNDPLAGMPNQ
jgi:arylsulfatase A-like enzyme